MDLDWGRLRHLAATCVRLQLPSVPCLVADATLPLPLRPTFLWDGILIDAPCSGLGVLRRHPELKWRRQPQDLARFAAQQQAMLRQAAAFLRPGGRLVYVTCTTEPEENEGVVQIFLQEQPDFSQLQDPAALPSHIRPFWEPPGYFRSLPERQGLDGFFAAVLVKGQG